MKKRILATLLATAMICTTVVGCGSGSSDASEGKSSDEKETAQEDAGTDGEEAAEDKTLSILCYPDPEGGNETELQQLAIYEKVAESIGAKLEIIVAPWDEIESKLVITNEAGNPADLVLFSSQKLASLVNNGALLALDDYIDSSMNKDDISQAVWDAGTYVGDGNMYCILSSAHCRGLWYNTDYVKEAPKTWDEAVEVAQQVMAENEGVWGMAFQAFKGYGSAENTWGPLTWAGGGVLSNEDGSAAWANEATANAIQFVSDCINVYKVAPEGCVTSTDPDADNCQLFKNGQLAMFTNGSYRHSEFASCELADKFQFAPMPEMVEGGGSPFFANGWAWGIPSKSANPDLAWEFINAFSQADIQVEHSLIEGGLPISMEAQSDSAFSEGWFLAYMENLNANARSMDPFVYFQEGLEELCVTAASYCMDPTADLNAMLQESQDAFNEQYYGK